MQDRLLFKLGEEIAGRSSQIILEMLKGKKDVNEFKIADKLKMTINQTRNILYKLYAHDIVSFIRKKDKRKGWYIYYWTLNITKALDLIAKMKEKEIHQQEALLRSRENKRFYICKGCRIEMTEETALHHNFTCPECGSLFELHNEEKKVLDIKKALEKLKRELVIIKEELAKSKLSIVKKPAKKMKKKGKERKKENKKRKKKKR